MFIAETKGSGDPGMPNHGKGGRKPERDEVKRAAVAVRTTPTIKVKLEAAAKEAGRSVTQEIEARLEASLEADQPERTVATMRLLSALATDIERAEQLTGNRWHKNLVTWAMVREAVATEIELGCPENDRLLSDRDGIVSDQRKELIELGRTVEHHQATLAEFGFFAWSNAAAPRRPFGATIYDYEVSEKALESAQLPEANKQAARLILGLMRKADEERAAVGNLYAENIRQAVTAIAEGARLWEEEARRRGIDVTPEFRVPPLPFTLRIAASVPVEGNDDAGIPGQDAV